MNAGDFETQVGFCSVLNELCNVGRSVSMPATEELNDVPAYYFMTLNVHSQRQLVFTYSLDHLWSDSTFNF